MSLMERIEKAVKDRALRAKEKGGGKKDTIIIDSFRWFRLVSIPQSPQGTTLDVSTFNDEAAESILGSLRNDPDLAFIEIYVTSDAMEKLVRDFKIDRNYDSLLDTVRERISGDDDNDGQDTISWDERGLVITPALQQIFDPYFIVRHISPPHFYAPVDESKIPSNVDQILIGALKIEDGQGNPLGDTPIRALLQEEKGVGRLQRMQVHSDFDLILKAFPDEQLRSYPLGLNITCGLENVGNLRKVSLVQLDLHDTKLLADKARLNPNIDLSFTLLEGGGSSGVVKRTDISKYPGETKPIEQPDSIKGKKTIEKYEIAPNLSVPVNRKIGIEVALRYQDDNRVKTHIYRYLFRFFKYALRYVPGSNRMAMTGQFVKMSGETVIMLPPLAKGTVVENQTPGFVLSPESGKPNAFRVRKHPLSSVNLILNGSPIPDTGISIELSDNVEIFGKVGQEGDSQHEEFKFTLLPINSLNPQRREVLEKKSERNFCGLVEIQSNRTISLSSNEVVLGRSRLLHREANVGVDALRLKHRYVTWEVSARKSDSVFYYCEVQGRVTQNLAPLGQPIALGLVGTYHFYVDDFEFVVLLESTPRTEIALISYKEENDGE